MVPKHTDPKDTVLLVEKKSKTKKNLQYALAPLEGRVLPLKWDPAYSFNNYHFLKFTDLMHTVIHFKSFYIGEKTPVLILIKYNAIQPHLSLQIKKKNCF